MRQLTISRSITFRTSGSIEKYLQEIGKEEMISTDEEVVLARRIKKGDQEALQKLVNANLRFVVSVAKQYPNYYLSLNDLINEGNLGLIKAAQRFDETRGFKFISYAVWWIRQCIIQAISEQSSAVRLPLNKVVAINKLKRAFAELEQKYEREPTHEELSKMTDMNVEQIEATLKAAPRHMSLDAPFQVGEDMSLHDILEDTKAATPDGGVAYTDSLTIDVNRMLSSLTVRQKNVIQMYFGLGRKDAMSLESIGEAMGLTMERVRQIKNRAICKLRVGSDRSLLKEYLG